MVLKRALLLQEKRVMQKAKHNSRKGFTLVELVVALAVFIVIITISFSALSRFFAMRSAQEQEMILQQNFRFALDKMAYDFRQASGEDIILEPGSNAMGEVLIFANGTNDVYYFLCSDGGVSVLYRGERTHDNLLTSNPCNITTGWISKQPVGNLEYFGKERTISFSSMVFSRNSAYESSP